MIGLSFQGCQLFGPGIDSTPHFANHGSIGRGRYDGVFESSLRGGIDGLDKWTTSSACAHVWLWDKDGNHYQVNGLIKMNADTVNEGQESRLSKWSAVHVWQVSDTGEVGFFHDTLQPPNLFEITYPKQLMQRDSVSVSKGFTINYTTTGADHVRIRVMSNTFLANAFDTNVKVSKLEPYFESKLLASTGSFTITPEMLSRFPTPSIIDISIAAMTLKTSIHCGKEYLFRSNVISDISTFSKF